MTKKLKNLYKIQEILKKTGYIDISRISKEILDYSQKKDILLEDILEQLKTGKPWEYISGEVTFRDIALRINRNVLIPRIETEQIVDIARENLEGIRNIVDIGTGSGCIIISLCKELGNGFNYYGIDICKKALKVAQENALLNNLETNITFLQSDLLNNFKLESPTLYIANLPYIPKIMYENLDRSVKDFEPKKALLGGDNGLIYYEKLIKQIDKGNKLLIEIEPSTLEDVKKLNKNYKIYKDIYGKNRFILFNLT